MLERVIFTLSFALFALLVVFTASANAELHDTSFNSTEPDVWPPWDNCNATLPCSPYQGLTPHKFLEKVFNMTRPEIAPAKKSPRQVYNILKYCTDSNLGGTCAYMTNTSPSMPSLSATYNNKISSVQLYFSNYLFVFWTGPAATGSVWAFRAPTTVNFGDIPGFNDNIESFYAMDLAAVGWPTSGIQVFSNSNLGGRSVYIVPGDYVDIITSSYWGTFCNDCESSWYQFAGTSVYQYENTYYGGSLYPSAPIITTTFGEQYINSMPSGWNDKVSSIKVLFWIPPPPPPTPAPPSPNTAATTTQAVADTTQANANALFTAVTFRLSALTANAAANGGMKRDDHNSDDTPGGTTGRAR